MSKYMFMVVISIYCGLLEELDDPKFLGTQFLSPN